MNERYGIEPEACSNHHEMRFLLDKFGPYTGRYIAAFPADWEIRIRNMIREWPPLESARAKVLLNRALERKALLRLDDVSYNSAQSWLVNAEAALLAKKIDGVVANRENLHSYPTIDDIDLPPTTDERISATPNEFARVSHALIAVSPEIFLIDPYLDPTRQDRFSVLVALFSIAAKLKTKKISLWVSKRHVETQISELEKSLRIIAFKSGLKASKIEMNIVDDLRTEQRLHARYLLSIRGAIRFDQGFQSLKEQKIEISVVGKESHNDLITSFLENSDRFILHNKIEFSI